MTLLIAVGAVMLFVVWNQGKKRQQKVEERREVEETTGKLKQELEKTANEVIGRMENQVSGLEDLLDESEKNRTVLEGRVAELKKLLKRSEGQSTEIRDLLSKLEEASDTVEDLQRKLEAAEKRISMTMQMPVQMPMQSTMMPMSSLPPMNPTQPMMTPSMMSSMMTPPLMTTPLPNVPSPISPPPILSSRQSTPAPAPVVPKPSAETEESTEPVKAEATATEAPKPKKMDKAEMKAALEKVSAESSKAEPKDFAKVLEKSMEKSEAAEKASTVQKVPAVPDRRPVVVSSRSSQRAATVVNSTEPVKIESRRAGTSTSTPETRRTISAREADKAPINNNTAKIKDMLLEGMSVEDIARETGLGRGAVELVQEMTRRKLERK